VGRVGVASGRKEDVAFVRGVDPLAIDGTAHCRPNDGVD